MNPRHLAPILLLSCVSLSAQSPAPAPPQPTRASQLGFAYNLPADWEVVDTAPMLPAAQLQAEQGADSKEEKHAASCTEIPLTARHGSPANAIVVVAIPFDCYGQTMSQQELPGFGLGASEGLTKTFNISDTTFGAYAVGSHNFWIERAKGTLKASPDTPRTIEIACTILKKAAACWLVIAADDDGLRAFESGTVTLEGEPPTALIPADAFARKP